MSFSWHPIQHPTSPFPSILHTNTIPSPLQATAITATLTTAQAYLDNRQSEIARLNTILATLTADSETWAAHIHANAALLSPARRMPDDVLKEIFERCFSREYKSLHNDQPPWVLGRVCRQWREVVISSPRIWSFLSFHLSEFPLSTEKCASGERTLELYLSRSGQCLLSIRVRGSNDSHPMLGIISRFAHRWQDVTFRMPLHDESLPLAKANLHNLHSLTLQGSSNNLTTFSNAPNLTSFCVKGSATAQSYVLPWDQITHFQTQTSVNTSARLFPLLPNLRKCTLAQSTYKAGIFETNFVLGSLHTLVIAPTEYAFFRTVIDHVQTPGLKSLVVRWQGRSGNDAPMWHQQAFLLFLSRVGKPGLDLLAIDGIVLVQTQVEALMRAVPTLQALVLNSKNWSASEENGTVPLYPSSVGVNLIAKVRSGELVLPRLTKLHIDGVECVTGRRDDFIYCS